MKTKCLFIGAAACLLGGAAHAATTGTGEAGFVLSRGNADTETANAKLALVVERGYWRHNFGLAGLYGRSASVTIATRMSTRWQTDRRFGRGAFWFTGLSLDDDRFSGFDYQGSASAGLGREFLNTERTRLKGQLGLGCRLLRPEQLVFDPEETVIGRIKGEQSTDAVANGAVTLEHALTGSTKLLVGLGFESGQDNTLSRGDLALQVKMTELLAISVGLNVRTNSEPPPPLEKTDTLTTVNLVYQYK
jgi:putative salt-induced outer membrane protein